MNLNEFRIAIDLLGFKPLQVISNNSFAFNAFKITLSPQVSFTMSISNSEIFGTNIRCNGVNYTDIKKALKAIIERIKIEKLRAERVDEIMSHLPKS